MFNCSADSVVHLLPLKSSMAHSNTHNHSMFKAHPDELCLTPAAEAEVCGA